MCRVAVGSGTLTPYAAEDIEHNTDIFDLPKGPEPVGRHGPTFADTFFETRGGVEGTYMLDRNQFFGTAEFRRFEYENFSLLNHNEELFDGGLKWKAGDAVDGQLEYRHEQRMVQFQDLQASTQLILETENNATGSVNVNVTPEWRLETRLNDHVIDSPRANLPGLSLHEESGREALKYVGLANLSAGFQLDYLKGQYLHDPQALNPNYHQIGGSLAATYIISGLTNFTGNIGYTHRSDPTNAGLSGVTGRLSYQHSISPKTSISVQFSRLLNSYLTTGGNEVDTIAGAYVNWQATYKILVRVGYSYTNSEYPGTPLGSITINRVDHYQNGNFEVSYQVLHWLSIRPYARILTRHSNDPVDRFNSNIVGVEVLIKEPRLNR